MVAEAKFAGETPVGTMTVNVRDKTTGLGYNTLNDYEISTDLPWDQLGEFVGLEIERAWKSGQDPVKLTVQLFFR